MKTKKKKVKTKQREIWGNGIGYGFRSRDEPLWFSSPRKLRKLTDKEMIECKETYGSTPAYTAGRSCKIGIFWESEEKIGSSEYLVWWSSSSKEAAKKIDKIVKKIALAEVDSNPEFRFGVDTDKIVDAIRRGNEERI